MYVYYTHTAQDTYMTSGYMVAKLTSTPSHSKGIKQEAFLNCFVSCF